jgi:hypothetical protein
LLFGCSAESESKGGPDVSDAAAGTAGSSAADAPAYTGGSGAAHAGSGGSGGAQAGAGGLPTDAGLDTRAGCSSDGDCASNESCEAGVCQPDRLCTPSLKSCTPGSEQVVECSADGLLAIPVEDCAISGRVCMSAVCMPIICSAGTQYCEGGEARACSAKGESYATLDVCTQYEHCDVTAGTASCKADVCEPDRPVCNGFVATRCNLDGSGYVSEGVDCAATTQACSDGVCVARACEPGVRSCDANRVVQCNADALTTTTIATCVGGEYCDPVGLSCRPQLCSPGTPVCNQTVATTCDASGADYDAGGTDCSPKYCQNGSCIDALFFEDFEDGDISDWFTPPGDNTFGYYSRTIVSGIATESTKRSLKLTKVKGNYVYGGAGYFFNPKLVPTRVSWWMRAAQSNQWSCYFALFGDDGTSGQMFVVYFDASGRGNITWAWRGDVVFSYAANRWYHFELRNIDWTQRTYDFYIDGSLRASALPLDSTRTSIGFLDFYNNDQGATCYIDQIVMQ